MENTTYIFLALGFLGALALSYFQYYYREKSKAKHISFLFVVRWLGIFLLLVALINPTFKVENYVTIKPKLNLLLDNSKSITNLNKNSQLDSVYKILLSDADLNDKFTFNSFQFSDNLKILDSLSFDKPQTNIVNALIQLEKLNDDNNQVTILLSDGNQTLGYDYIHYQPSHTINPIVFGDTLQYNDVSISQINANKFTYVGNEFPIEVFINLDGNLTKRVALYIKKNGTVIKRKNVTLQPNSSKRVEFTLKSVLKGTSFYTVEVSSLFDENNKRNNRKKFSIEAIDEKTKILIVSAVNHPDIGMLKRSIETNKKREAVVKKPSEINALESYQSIILYQPTYSFKEIFSSLVKNPKNIFIITGNQTDFTFINSKNLGFRKNSIPEREKATPVFNNNFLPFQQEDLGFDSFSPISDVFGEITFTKPSNTLLYQSINGIENNQPLLSSIDNGNNKTLILFGEGFWQWRATSFLKENSFQKFDSFINNLIQFITNNSIKNRLDVEIKPLHYSNSPIEFIAYFFDENFKFDTKADLELELTNTITNEKLLYPFSNKKIKFSVSLNSLEPAIYNYRVLEKRSNIVKKGKIEVLKTEIETQFLRANHDDLQLLANNSKGKLYFPNQISQLKEDVLTDNSFKNIQTSNHQQKELLNWWQYLLCIVFLFSIEWFVRKYHGKI